MFDLLYFRPPDQVGVEDTRQSLAEIDTSKIVPVFVGDLHALGLMRKCVGNLGSWQLFQTSLLVMCKYTTTVDQYLSLFISPVTEEFICANNPSDKCDPNCTSHIFMKTEFDDTVVMEFDLVCQRKFIINFIHVMVLLGVLFGNLLFGYYSDQLGRRTPLLIGIAIEILSEIATSVATNIYVYAILRFFTAIGIGGVMVVSFVLLVEIIGLDWRTFLCIIYQVAFVIGTTMLPILSHTWRKWRDLLLIVSLSQVVLLLYFCFLTESPRWLIANNKEDRAVRVLERAAVMNGLPHKHIRPLVHTFITVHRGEDNPARLSDFLKSKPIRKYLLALGINWFVASFCLFSLGRHVGVQSKQKRPYFILSGAIQVPGLIFSVWAITTLGRKILLLFGNFIGSTLMICSAFLLSDKHCFATDLLSLAGFSIAYLVCFIYSGEIFPTGLRCSAVGICSLVGGVGALLAPFLSVPERTKELYVIGILLGFIGMMFTCLLPETVNCKLPETVRHAELLDKRKWKNTEFNPQYYA